MIKILTIVGARPQFIKASSISRCIKKNFANELQEVIVHSGQHYDNNMSEIFFQELDIPKPRYQFNLKKISPLDKLNYMSSSIELAIQNENPDFVLLYGDTNTTLAGTYAASNHQIPIIHIEAGLRSYNDAMPEEFNRYTCDHASTLLFAPTEKAIQNLEKEGFSTKNKAPFNPSNPAVFISGDVMYDSLLHAIKNTDHQKDLFSKLQLKKDNYILASIHRNFNTDNSKRLNEIFEGFEKLSSLHNIDIVIPLHPRTNKQLNIFLDKDLELKIKANSRIKLVHPLTHFELLSIIQDSKMVITDSGGIQKEAFLLEKPSIIARETTEWSEIVDNGNAILMNADSTKMIAAFENFSQNKELSYPSFYGDGKAANFICEKIIDVFNNKIN